MLRMFDLRDPSTIVNTFKTLQKDVNAVSFRHAPLISLTPGVIETRTAGSGSEE